MNEDPTTDEIEQRLTSGRPVAGDEYRRALWSRLEAQRVEAPAQAEALPAIEPPRRKGRRRSSNEQLSRRARRRAWGLTVAYSGSGLALLALPFFGVLGVGPMSA